MMRFQVASLSVTLLLAGLAQGFNDKPHEKAWSKAKGSAEEAAKQGEYLAAAKSLEAYLKEWESKPEAQRDVTNAKRGATRFRGLASRWIMAKSKPAEHLKAFLRDLLVKPEGYYFHATDQERARSFAFALQHAPWLQAQVAQAFPMGVRVQSPGRKATKADQQAFLKELAKISKALSVPMLASGDHWKLTLNLEVATLGSTLPGSGSKMRSVRATGNCKLLDAKGETITTLRASGTGIHIDEAKGGIKASQKMAHDLLDKLVTHFITKLSQQPD